MMLKHKPRQISLSKHYTAIVNHDIFINIAGLWLAEALPLLPARSVTNDCQNIILLCYLLLKT